MELVSGGTLAGRITPRGLPPAEVARIGAAVAGALAVVHRSGLVHRDIKPANLLMSPAGDVKLSDFGIARELEAERLTAAADVIGTAAYLSPEQARGGDVGPPTDIYALGLVLLESLTGRREFPGQAVESALARLMRDPVVPPDLPAPWPGLLRGMTASDPAARPTAEQVAATLSAPAGTRVRAAGRRRRRDGNIAAAHCPHPGTPARPTARRTAARRDGHRAHRGHRAARDGARGCGCVRRRGPAALGRQQHADRADRPDNRIDDGYLHPHRDVRDDRCSDHAQHHDHDVQHDHEFLDPDDDDHDTDHPDHPDDSHHAHDTDHADERRRGPRDRHPGQRRRGSGPGRGHRAGWRRRRGEYETDDESGGGQGNASGPDG